MFSQNLQQKLLNKTSTGINYKKSITQIVQQLHKSSKQLQGKQQKIIQLQSKIIKMKIQAQCSLKLSHQQNQFLTKLKSQLEQYKILNQKLKDQLSKFKQTNQIVDNSRISIEQRNYVYIKRKAGGLIMNKQDLKNLQYKVQQNKQLRKSYSINQQYSPEHLQKALQQYKRQNYQLRKEKRQKQQQLINLQKVEKLKLEQKNRQILLLNNRLNIIDTNYNKLTNILSQMTSQKQTLNRELKKEKENIEKLIEQHQKFKKYHRVKMEELKQIQKLRLDLQQMQLLRTRVKQLSSTVEMQAKTILQFKQKYEQQVEKREEFQKLYEDTHYQLQKLDGKIGFYEKSNTNIKESFKNKQKQLYNSIELIMKNKNELAHKLDQKQQKISQLKKDNDQLSIRLSQIKNNTHTNINNSSQIPNLTGYQSNISNLNGYNQYSQGQGPSFRHNSTQQGQLHRNSLNKSDFSPLVTHNYSYI